MRRVVILLFILLGFVFGCQKDQSTDTPIEVTAKAAMIAFKEQSNVSKQQKNVIQQVSLQMLWDKAFHLNKDSLFVPLILKDTVYMDDDGNGKVLMNRRMHLIASYNNGWKFTIKALFPDKSSEKYHFSGKVLSTDYFVNDLSYSYFYKGKPMSKNQSILDNGVSNDSKKAAHVELECRTVGGYVNGQYNSSGTYCSFVHGNGGMDGSGPGEWQNFQPDPGGGGGPGGEGNNPFVKPTQLELKEQIKDKPFALIPNIPCDIIKKWLATAKFTVDQTTESKLRSIEETIKPGNYNSYLTNIQNINNAYSTVVNMDYFPITVSTLPVLNGVRLTPEQFIGHIRKNINNFIDTQYSTFKPYKYSGVDETNLWNSANPKNAVVAIDIKGPDNGSVIVSQYNNTGWTFTTIHEPMYGDHPVSGNRDFGYVKNTNGSYTFYTRGVDRLTGLDGDSFQKTTEFFSGEGYPFRQADALWTSFQNIVTNFVNKNGGNAGVAKQEIHRPDWSIVKDVINGKKPLSSLSTDCK